MVTEDLLFPVEFKQGELEMKAEDQKLEYPHCVYNDEGKGKVVNSLEEHQALEIHPVHSGVWMPNAMRRGKAPKKENKIVLEEPKEEITKEQADEIVEAQAEAKPKRGRRSAK